MIQLILWFFLVFELLKCGLDLCVMHHISQPSSMDVSYAIIYVITPSWNEGSHTPNWTRHCNFHFHLNLKTRAARHFADNAFAAHLRRSTVWRSRPHNRKKRSKGVWLFDRGYFTKVLTAPNKQQWLKISNSGRPFDTRRYSFTNRRKLHGRHAVSAQTGNLHHDLENGATFCARFQTISDLFF